MALRFISEKEGYAQPTPTEMIASEYFDESNYEGCFNHKLFTARCLDCIKATFDQSTPPKKRKSEDDILHRTKQMKITENIPESEVKRLIEVASMRYDLYPVFFNGKKLQFFYHAVNQTDFVFSKFINSTMCNSAFLSDIGAMLAKKRRNHNVYVNFTMNWSGKSASPLDRSDISNSDAAYVLIYYTIHELLMKMFSLSVDKNSSQIMDFLNEEGKMYYILTSVWFELSLFVIASV